MIRFRRQFTLATIAVTLALTAPAYAGKTQDAVKARGRLVCSVHAGLAGFSQADGIGNWSGPDVDLFAALAAVRNKEAMNAKDHVILPTLISKEPLGAMVRRRIIRDC
jgi:hypothetical protein